ncbi:hypothetical protein TanjilG_04334 [Lupinus angustifolius]|uniref:Clathrin adaptor alpha/beta/gamma-adaptin appendage Ig-like subdomain domain-containing protein n=1 Tax=Lupinus angustifolius TaxID=3871 RepID=A0A4P1RQL1_LUPAN|nr:hypothetical protein TanjilG_04334 [Lupinus angustifolius]
MELSLVPETIPPRAQVQCPLEVINLRPSRDVAVVDFSYKFGNDMVNVKLRLPAILNKFLQPIPVSAEEFFPQWRSLTGPPLKLQEVDPNPNNLVASTTFFSESTRAMLCLVILILICRLKEFIKEQLIVIPTVTHAPTQAPPGPPPLAQPASNPAALTDPGAMLAALL